MLTAPCLCTTLEIWRLKKQMNYLPVCACKRLPLWYLIKRIVFLPQSPKKLKFFLRFIPEAPPYYDEESLSDLPEKFFVSELIREIIYELYHEEIPYQTAVLVREFKEKQTLTKIVADIIVQRETQKFILIGEGGKMIKELGTKARQSIEEFLGRKVFLELLVRVKPKWRNDEFKLREYGY